MKRLVNWLHLLVVRLLLLLGGLHALLLVVEGLGLLVLLVVVVVVEGLGLLLLLLKSLRLPLNGFCLLLECLHPLLESLGLLMESLPLVLLQESLLLLLLQSLHVSVLERLPRRLLPSLSGHLGNSPNRTVGFRIQELRDVRGVLMLKDEGGGGVVA